MKMRVSVLLVAMIVGFFIASDAGSHSGGTNANGCHTNHKTGSYHCHNAKTPSPGFQTYCHVVNGERRCGYAYSTCQSLQSKFGGTCQPD